MKLFDLHCDTLYRAFTENRSIFEDDFHISFRKTKNIKPYIQCLAVWIPDEYRGQRAEQLFNGCADLLGKQIAGTNIVLCKCKDDMRKIADNGGTGVILTVESGAVLAGKIENIKRLADRHVKMMTLTWNGTNELGDGVGIEKHNRGLSDFGKRCVKEMEKYHIIVDVSHASEKMFYDVAEIAEKPFAASHSNAKEVCPHQRNLSDEQLQRTSGRPVRRRETNEAAAGAEEKPAAGGGTGGTVGILVQGVAVFLDIDFADG